MDKKIYNMANDIVTDFTELESRKLSEKEIGKYQRSFKKMEGRKKHTGAG